MAPESLVDSTVDGRYRVLAHLADGGMASVYLATDQRLDRDVALKVMRADLARDQEFLRRFRQEARSAARLAHPHVVGVFDQGNDGSHVFLAMELVRGRTLRDLLQHAGALSPRTALQIFLPVLQALDAAHRAGIVHRDINPENVLIREDGVVKVADFGLARAITAATATTSGLLLGTAAYLAPELVEHGSADARSDVYAAGLVLYEMLTGVKAFAGDSPIHVAFQHVHGRVGAPSDVRASVPAELDALVALASDRDPRRRPPDAGALLRATDHVLDELGDRAAPLLGGAPTTVIPSPPLECTSPLLPAARRRQPDHPSPSEQDASPAAQRRAPVRRRRRGRTALLLLLALLLLGALLAGGRWYLTDGPGGQVAVPALHGMTSARAVQALGDDQLQSRQISAYSENAAKGTVLYSEPGDGSKVRRGSTVLLTISRGPERHNVPRLVGSSVAAATSALTSAHLLVGTVRGVWNQTVPAGRVLASDPGAGSPQRRGSRITLTVSKGKAPIKVAAVKGLSASAADLALRKQGLRSKTGTARYSDTVAEGAVLSQSPPAGNVLHRGQTVSIVLSKGPQMVSVPNVSLRSESSAIQTLQAAGLRVRTTTVLGGILHLVRLQDPVAGSRVRKGSTITLTIV